MISYSDSDYARDRDTRRSTSGNLFLLGDGAVTWCSRRQTSVALSTIEAEYMALSQATQEAVWLRTLLEDLRKESQSPTTIMEDNQGVISTALNPVFHRKTKHIHIRYHYVRESIADNIIDVIYCPSAEMTADALTKPLTNEQF